MIDLTEQQDAMLRRLNRAGAEGLPLGADGCPGCMALHFGFLGLVVISNTVAPPQRAVITQRGRAFMARTAA